METNNGMEAIKNACSRGLRLELTHGHKSEFDYGPMVVAEYEKSKETIVDALAIVAAGLVVVAENRRLNGLVNRLSVALAEKGGIGE